MEKEHSALDTHCHSKYSGEASEWFLKKMGCPESFTEPMSLYERAKHRGMQFVTITDHNVIDGCLEIAHLPDVILSCEVACYFPDNQCKLDVVTLDITEEQHREMMMLRQNVFDLVAYLNNENIFHILAHPLYVMNGRLDLEHFEQCLLLFKNMEVLNGARTKAQNLTIKRLLDNLQKETIERLANKHDMQPIGEEPWNKIYTAGSDDHGGLLIGTNATAVPKVDSFAEFLQKARNGETFVVGTIGTAHTLAHNIYRAAYLYIVNILKAYKPKKGDTLNYMVMKLLFDDDSYRPTATDIIKRKVKKKLGRADEDTSPGQILTIIKDEAKVLFRQRPEYKELLMKELPEDKDELNRAVFTFMSELGNMVLARLSRDMIESVQNLEFSRVLDLIPTLGTTHFFLLPYYVSYGATNRSNRLIDEVSKTFLPESLRVRARKKVAMFTDTFDEVNGVAVIIKQMAQEARKAEAELYIVKSGPEPSSQEDNIVHFHSVADVALPEYPETKMHFPSLLDILDWCEKQEFTCIHAATPGTMGMIALLVAKILHLPLVSTYHTEITDYVRYLTGSESMAKYSAKLLNWFYGSMSVVFAPSEASKLNLIDHGVDPDIVNYIPWGVDMELFHPSRRNRKLWEKFGWENKVVLFYAGRISKEKDLDILADAFIELSRNQDDICLVLAGGGPYREELEKQLADYPARFLGYLNQTELAEYYASADMFVFPSTTDTFGNVVIEAQATGLPVIVSDKGGPKENMVHGETGYITHSRDTEDLKKAILTLVKNAELRKEMAAAARPAVAGKSRSESFLKYWAMHL